MRILLLKSILPFQILGTITLLFATLISYAFFYSGQYYPETFSHFLRNIDWWIIALVVVGTIALFLLAGMPVTMVTGIYFWWLKKPALSIAGSVAGSMLMVLSQLTLCMVMTEVDGGDGYYTRPATNMVMSLTGWFLLAFCLLHYYPARPFSNIRTED